MAHRFFVPPGTIVGDSAILPPDAAHHAVSVLRLRVGDSIDLRDGTGAAYEAVLATASGKSATARVVRAYSPDTEPPLRITVAQALPKTSDKIEQVLQHGTEVGAAGFVFFTGARSVARLADGEKIEKRLARWKSIVQGAAEQSGRALLPDVAWLPTTTAVAADSTQFGATLILHEAASLPLRDALSPLLPNIQRLRILVGPEGGFTDEEVAFFAGKGATTISLGPRILRTETAALVALAQILFAATPSTTPSMP